MKSFSELPLADPIRQAIDEAGYTVPTPIQTRAIPPLLEGRDLLGCAQTGTGKTAAFALPILQRLSQSSTDIRRRAIRALVLTPTRELAAQIVDSFRTYGSRLQLRTIAVFGGVSKNAQEQALRKGTDILVATPGRLLDHMNDGTIDLKRLEVFVLDEADRMLDMGFIHDVKRVIAALPAKRQSLFFSATMPPAVAGLAGSLLTDPVQVAVAPQATPAERIRQTVLFVDQGQKDALLESILSDEKFERVLIFTRTKHRADRVARKLKQLEIPSDAIHGNKAQNARTRALQSFKDGSTRVLVATDIAARGIDVDGITHVINYELPNEPESYVHRIGRTARAGSDGSAVSFCAGDERDFLSDIEKTMGRPIKVVRGHPFHSQDAEQGLVSGESGRELRKRKAAEQGQRRSQRSSPSHGQQGQQGRQRKADAPKQSRSAVHERERGQSGGRKGPGGRDGHRASRPHRKNRTAVGERRS